MTSKNLGKYLYHYRRPNRFTNGLGAALPPAYKKFWKEWKLTEPTAVHYVKEQGKLKLNEATQEVIPIQNIPIPAKYPKVHNEGIWGGEGIVQGFTKRNNYRRRLPRLWVPLLKKTILYSEILNEYMRVTVTNRTMQLIHENYGFDHYILKTPACDLKSELALKIKRRLLIALADKTLYPDDEAKQNEIYEKYKQYLEAYTREEIEWYGLTFKEACQRIYKAQLDVKPEPLKFQYRRDLIARLKETVPEEEVKETTSWLSQMNPFAKGNKNAPSK